MAVPEGVVSTQSEEEALKNLLEQGKDLYGQRQLREAEVIFNHLISSDVHVGETLYGRGLISRERRV